jgi:tetratricopeptide (TPR) repeat protein
MLHKLRLIAVLGIVLVMIASFSGPATGQDGQDTPQRDPVQEQEILNRLEKINPEAVLFFQEATRAMDAEDYQAARRGYERVLKLAPDFPAALRRYSQVILNLGDVELALLTAQRAYDVDPSPDNAIGLAYVLLATEEPENIRQGLVYARQAAEQRPEDEYTNTVFLYAAAMSHDMEAIKESSARLLKIVPELPIAHYFAGLMAADDGKWEVAEKELRLSQKLGMPAEAVQEALSSGITSQAFLHRWLRRGEYSLVGWIAGMGILFFLGILLSRLTLAAVQRSQATGSFEAGGGERFVRGCYRWVIAAASGFFYLSVPLIILLILTATGGVIYLFSQSARFPSGWP